MNQNQNENHNQNESERHNEMRGGMALGESERERGKEIEFYSTHTQRCTETMQN